MGRIIAALTPNLQSSEQWILGFLGGVALVGLLFLAARTCKNLNWGAATHDSDVRRYRAIVRLYVQLIRFAEREGITRSASTTPKEFVQQVHQRWATAGPDVVGFMDLYCRARFSRHRLTAQEFAQAAEYVNRFRRILRSR